MLTRLVLRDFVIARHAELSPEAGFCVLTGETGAGKSLLVDALSILAGGRAAGALVRRGAAQAEAEATFDLTASPAARQYLQAHDLADDNSATLLARRVIGGKRPAIYLNGRQATLAQLSDLMSRLIEICGQHAHYSLRSPAAHRPLLDAFAGAQQAAAQVATAHAAWRAADDAARAAQTQAADAARRRAMLSETLAELAQLDYSADKWQSMNDTLTRTANLSDLADGCARALTRLRGEGEADGGAQGQLAAAMRALKDMARHDAATARLASALQDADAIIADAARDVAQYAAGLALDPQAQEAAEAFVAECHRLARKYGLGEPERLGDFAAEQQAQLDALPTADDAQRLAAAASAAQEELMEKCRALSALRQTAAKKLAEQTNALLTRLAMPRARLHVALVPLEAPGARGAEKVELQIATRADMPPAAIADVASGGELSRLGLAIQIAAGAASDIAISVFDEVDAGIGGAAAGVVGDLLRQLGAARQVLCVTHLPQVAARAHAHWRVASGDELSVAQLDASARIEEIARMQSGEHITDAARQYAKELLKPSASG